jgi:hypothetical protein
MDFTAKEQRFIQRAEGSGSHRYRTLVIVGLVLGLLCGFLAAVTGVKALIEGAYGGATRASPGGLILGFFLLAYVFTDTEETAYSVVRKLRSGQGDSRKEAP